MAHQVRIESFGRQVLESLPSGILVVDVTSRVLFLNGEAGRIFDVDRESFAGSMLVSHSRFRPLIASINQFRRKTPALIPTRQQFEGAIVREDGRVLPLGFSISNLVNSRRRVLGYVLIFRDLTDVQRLRDRARQSEMLAALGTMAAGVAHEIRNPLHTIRAALDVLEVRLGRGEDPSQYLDVVRREIERADRTVGEILSYSKRSEAHFRLGDASECLVSALDHVSIRTGISILREIESDLPAVFYDRERLLRVFINLLENAMDALEAPGQIRLAARRTVLPAPAAGEGASVAAVALEVSDTGRGIAPADLPHVFEPFFTRKSSRGGTGLGLAICQRIVEEHGGLIDAASAPGQGTTFRVALPARGLLAEEPGQV